MVCGGFSGVLVARHGCWGGNSDLGGSKERFGDSLKERCEEGERSFQLAGSDSSTNERPWGERE